MVGPHVLLLRETPVVSTVLALPSLPSSFISVFLVLFSFQSWSLPGILSLLLCVLTRRPALLPADAHGWAPRLCSRLGHAGRLLPWMGLAARGWAPWTCWGFNTTYSALGTISMGTACTAHPRRVGTPVPLGPGPQATWGGGWEPVSLPLGLCPVVDELLRRLHASSSSVSCRCSAEHVLAAEGAPGAAGGTGIQSGRGGVLSVPFLPGHLPDRPAPPPATR